MTGDELIEHHAEGEHVAALIEALARGLFRRHVRHRANHDAESGVDVADRGTLIVRLLLQFREAEVDERRVAVPGDQHIGRFDVPMHDARLVRGGQAIGDAAQQVGDVVVRTWLRSRPVAERATVDELRHEILAIVELAGVVDRQNVRMTQGGRDLGLALKAAARFRIG